MTLRSGAIDFFVIGSMKSATTDLCDWLDAQPGVAVSDPKEPCIFVSDDAVAHWTPRLESLFPSGSEQYVRGEGSTDYTKFPLVEGVPRRLHQTFPDARLVYLMRHPVARMLSQYSFEWRLGRYSASFEEALASYPDLLDNSRYALQLTQWLEVFPPEQILPVFYETYSHSPRDEVARVLPFIGAAIDTVVEPGTSRSNVTATIVPPTLARRLLRDSLIGRVVRPAVPDFVIDAYRGRLTRKSTPRVSDDLSGRLVATLDEDLAELGDLLGIPHLSCETWHEVTRTARPVLHGRSA